MSERSLTICHAVRFIVISMVQIPRLIFRIFSVNRHVVEQLKAVVQTEEFLNPRVCLVKAPKK
jgi:hypothetical protein